jgi:hypothetical protein
MACSQNEFRRAHQLEVAGVIIGTGDHDYKNLTIRTIPAKISKFSPDDRSVGLASQIVPMQKFHAAGAIAVGPVR